MWVICLIYTTILLFILISSPHCVTKIADTLQTKVSSHTSIEKCSFEFSVCQKAKDVGHDVVDSEQDEHSEGQVLRKTRIIHRISQLAILKCKSELVKDDEKVDNHVDNVDDETAGVHLGKSAEQNGDVN